jgi:hypothetical protein
LVRRIGGDVDRLAGSDRGRRTAEGDLDLPSSTVIISSKSWQDGAAGAETLLADLDLEVARASDQILKPERRKWEQNVYGSAA